MRRGLGRRTLFFFLLSAVSAALVLPTPADFRWVAWFTAGLAAFWAILLAIEDLAVPVPKRERKVRPGSETPFGPPPPPDFSQR
jgi:hypothetical protein